MNDAYVAPQGNVNSRKVKDPSGYVLFSPGGTKTFRTLYDAVLFGVRKGYQMHYTRPTKSDGVPSLAFVSAVVKAQEAKNAPVED
jgi:hypothetical protein